MQELFTLTKNDATCSEGREIRENKTSEKAEGKPSWNSYLGSGRCLEEIATQPVFLKFLLLTDKIYLRY